MYVHPSSLIMTNKIGRDTKIWAFCNILEGATIGKSCNICDHVFVENDVVIGDRVTVKCGVQLWDGLRVEDDVFIGPNVTFTNDKFPRSKAHQEKVLVTTVCQGSSIGANSTILPGITIGKNAMVGAGSVVTKDVPPNSIVMGNPARVTAYVDISKPIQADVIPTDNLHENEVVDSVVNGVKIIYLSEHEDIRGTLNVGEYLKHVPFPVKRFFLVYKVPTKEVRGEHAHKLQHQFLVCVHGSMNVILDDGQKRCEVELSRPSVGIYIPPLTWGIQYKYSNDAVMLALASDYYDPADYIRDYDEFKKYLTR